MKLIKKLTPVALASSIALAGAMAPVIASAEVSSSATLASMYLWRGQDISASAPVVSGDITYSHESGAYASLWISSIGGIGTDGGDLVYSTEADYTIGFAGEAGDLGYDVGYYIYTYPETGEDLSDAGAEVYLGLSYGDFGFKGFFDAKDDKTYNYYTFSYGIGSFSAMIGMNDDDDDTADYTHLDLTYAATDSLSFTVSDVVSKDSSVETPDNILYMIAYSLPIDLK